MKRLFLILSWVPLFSQGQVVVDGDCSETAWRILGLVNTTGTANTSFGSANTMGVLKYHSNATTLFLAVTGNVDANNNIVLFIDDVSYNGRGPNKLGANMSSVFTSVFKTTSASCPTGFPNPAEPNGLSGSIMDNGFDADYAFAINKGNTGTNMYMDAVRFSDYNNDALPTPAYLAGPVYVGSSNQSGATASYGVSVSGWNSGSSQISFAWQNGYDAATAPSKGVEFSIPYSFLPGVALGHQLRFFVLITNADGYASNVCIPGDPGASSLGCSFNLSTITNSGKDIFYTEPLVALPLRFLGVKAIWAGESVQLNWSVAEQGEGSTYDVERSVDGVLYKRIGTLPSRGLVGVSSFEFRDANPEAGKNHYRIAAHTRTGTVTYSKSVWVDNQRVSLIQIFPNPTADQFFVRVGDVPGTDCYWYLHNDAGQRVLSGKLSGERALACITIPPTLTNGTYRFSLIAEGKSTARTLQIQR
ncbi:MAG: hypothetical protein ACKO6Q_08485 [Bacteroidota bacterium]